MSSIPSSRYLFYPITWYSFLIVTGVLIAVILACREEKRAGLPKDTVIDLALLLLPCGIIGARLYYVVFSLPQFSGDFLSVFRIWEGDTYTSSSPGRNGRCSARARWLELKISV